ncbi:HIRAN domain-containing protein [Planococcus maritimus]|uniref:HIRAN domain-containing protein n=1 Tax=Planococcus maritimus TaxID=192421 RepID=A0A7D7MES3_PLAMR|nr:HIRAN domain-containing protein [Planococcus maritimus]QMT17433.1 HIRAN domain-containing protein [Planococcus maritimus]
MEKHKSLWLVWQNVDTRLFYHVATLSFFDSQYTFQYTHQSEGPQKLKDALKNGYLPHPMFPDLEKEYKSKDLFGAFKRRLPSEIRADFPMILNDLHLTKDYSEMDLLERTRGKLGSDQYSFEKPLKVVNGLLKTSFYINGMAYQNLPENWPDILKTNKKIKLQLEPDNPVDENAVAIYTDFGIKLGYVPRFYASGIAALLNNQMIPDLKINFVNEVGSSSWWVNIEFECELPPLNKDELTGLDPIFEQVI